MPQAADMKPRTEQQHRCAMAATARRWEAARAANDADMTMANCAAEAAARREHMKACAAASRWASKQPA